MSFKPYPIVPFEIGLERDKQPFLLENDAFPQLNNCYLYQKRIERRMGNEQLGRLVQEVQNKALANSAASPYVANIISFAPATPATMGLSPGSVTVTLGAFIFVDDGEGNLDDGAGNTGTIDYWTSDISLSYPGGVFAVSVTFSYYTGRPVMALPLEETTALNQEELKAFDTVKANLFSNALQRFVDISYDTAGNPISWTGSDSDFFWTWNYYSDATTGNKIFWATNNVIADGIKYYTANAYPIPAGQGWVTPVLRTSSTVAGNVVNTCLLIVSYRNRLVLLNTNENIGGVNRNFPQRARWCQNGTPIPSVGVTPWYSDIPGLGGYIDAPTSEQIVSCGFYKDTLVVFFERSTWQLFYTGNEALPFAWQRINTQFGCESTFSVVGFDKGLFAVGNVAIVTSDSVNVERIDLKIPTEVYDFHNQTEGPQRVHGIRDYFYQFVYWTFPNAAQNCTFPNKVLVFNYLDGAYSFYDDSYTCFGYYQSIRDLIWSKAKFPWEGADPSTWTSGKNQADFPSIVAGNQQGFVMILDQKTSNDPSLYVTNITQAVQAVITSPDHNLQRNQFVKFSGVLGMTGINDLVGKIQTFTANTITVDIDTTAMAAYTGAGYMTVLNNYEVVTKKFNPFYTVGQKVRSSYGDFYVERTDSGAVTVDFLIDDSYSLPVNTQTVSTAKEYGPLTPVGKIWQRTYADCMGQYLQMRIYLSDDQIRDPLTKLEASPSKENIVLHAINFWMAPSGRLQSYDMV